MFFNCFFLSLFLKRVKCPKQLKFIEAFDFGGSSEHLVSQGSGSVRIIKLVRSGGKKSLET